MTGCSGIAVSKFDWPMHSSWASVIFLLLDVNEMGCLQENKLSDEGSRKSVEQTEF